MDTNNKEFLLQFKDGKKIEEGERKDLEPYERMGLIFIGVSFSKREVRAKLTESGKLILGIDTEETIFS